MKHAYSYILSLVVATSVLMVSCSNDDVSSEGTNTPIIFGAQVEGHSTRAGLLGVMDNTTLATTGFGVFSYSTSSDYDQWLTNATEIYYTQSGSDLTDVHLHPSNWTYDTQKEWTKNTKISFLAYAPYVATGASGAGITSVGGASLDATTVDYQVATKPSESVDLLWGINGETGLPWINATAEKTGGLVLFTFYHALAAIGFHVQAMVDSENNLIDLGDESKTGLLGTDCKVTLKSITLKPSSGGFYESGVLNLNNNVEYSPYWTTKSGTIAELKLDNVVGGDYEDIDEALSDQGDKKPSGEGGMTNSGIIETANSQAVIAKSGGKEQFFMLIPDEVKNYTATIEYYVTYKTSNDTYKRLDYTGVNAGTANITGLALQAGIKYYLNFVIGLTTIKLNVTATDWSETSQDVNVTIEHGTSANSSLTKERP